TVVGGLYAAVAALTPLKFDYRLKQVRLSKIGPQRIGHIYFAVGDLPEEEIRDSHLSAGSDQQIGVRQAGSIDVALDVAFAQLFGIAGVCQVFEKELPASLHYFGAAAVVEGDSQQHSGAMSSLSPGTFYFASDA